MKGIWERMYKKDSFWVYESWLLDEMGRQLEELRVRKE